MGTKVRKVGHVVIVDFSKQFEDETTGPSLSAEVERLVAAGNRYILVNMENVPFVDSAMLGELIAAKKAVLVARAELKMLRPRKQVLGLLARTNLEKVLECFEDERMAVRSFGS